MVKKSELLQCFVSGYEKNRDLRPANVVDGLYAIARSLNEVSSALNNIGLADASTPMGAIELLSGEIKDGFAALSSSVGDLSRSVEDLPSEVKDGLSGLYGSVHCFSADLSESLKAIATQKGSKE